MCRKRIRLIVLRSMALGLIIAGFLAPGAQARAAYGYQQDADAANSNRRHTRRGLTPPASDQKLLQLQKNLQSLQNEFAETTLNTYQVDQPVTVFEINEIAALPPESQPATDRRHRGPDGHRLRHERKRARNEEGRGGGNQRDEAEFGGFKIKADLHNSRDSDSEQFFERAVQDSSSASGRLAERRGSHSYMGVLHSKKRKACPPSHSGKERLMCPTRNAVGYDVCINVDQLCDHNKDCPNGEDESQVNCLFYRTTMGHFKKVVDAVVSLTDHMVKSERTKREL